MENKNSNLVLRILSYVLVAVAASFTTFTLFGTHPQQGVSKLEALEALIAERFIGEVDQTAMEDAAANAMVEALGDPWSSYLPASMFTAYEEQMNNSYVGIGVTISLREDGKGLDIEKVEKGSAAEKAGVCPGDILIAVDGTSIAGMTMDAVGALIGGEEGTGVELTILRGEEELKLQAIRQVIEIPVAEGKMLENNIGLITIANFDARCAQETLTAIEQMQQQGAQALIFDVRFNPGGYKKEMVKILDHLLPEGELFRSEDYTGRVEVETSDAACLKMPMVVLVNGYSYSAAEFFAAVLSEYDWAKVVGQQTCGKGYFQNTYQFSDGSAVNLSVGKYYTPKGVSLVEVGGLVPDITVEVDQETLVAIYSGRIAPEDDPQIQAAVEYLLTGEMPEESSDAA